MAMTAGQFFLYLLIIIILRESLASAASPTSDSEASQTSDSVAPQTSDSEAPPSSIRVSTIPAVNTRARPGFYQLHGFQIMKDLLKVEVYIEAADESDPHMQRLVNQPMCTSSSLRINFRSLPWSSPELL